MPDPQRRTKRRYAHELYPHPEEGETRSLAAEVPYLYARFAGLEVTDTGWSKVDPPSIGGMRVHQMIDAARIALLADALAQGLVGDEAWAWADARVTDDMEIPYERAAHYGVDIEAIKPYPCGPEPEHHYHASDPDAHGRRWQTYAEGPESACLECTELIPLKEPSDV